MDIWKLSKPRSRIERILLIVVPVLLAVWWIAPRARIIRRAQAISADFKREGIRGHAYYSGDYLWISRCGVIVSPAGDREMQQTAFILERREIDSVCVLWIKDAMLTFTGLQPLEYSRNLRLINLVDCDVPEADVEQLRKLMPNSTIAVTSNRPPSESESNMQ